MDVIIQEYLASSDTSEAITCISELNAPNSHPDILFKCVYVALEKKDRDREAMCKLLVALSQHNNGPFTPDQFIKG